mmetsp:Transcript_180152/g.438322  ORF Transcript_180152/g.438322 Transcript_180152/m.438322 type:complete len:319 (+) Transcript_180152:1759-2715(+)
MIVVLLAQDARIGRDGDGRGDIVACDHAHIHTSCRALRNCLLHTDTQWVGDARDGDERKLILHRIVCNLVTGLAAARGSRCSILGLVFTGVGVFPERLDVDILGNILVGQRERTQAAVGVVADLGEHRGARVVVERHRCARAVDVGCAARENDLAGTLRVRAQLVVALRHEPRHALAARAERECGRVALAITISGITPPVEAILSRVLGVLTDVRVVVPERLNKAQESALSLVAVLDLVLLARGRIGELRCIRRVDGARVCEEINRFLGLLLGGGTHVLQDELADVCAIGVVDRVVPLLPEVDAHRRHTILRERARLV